MNEARRDDRRKRLRIVELKPDTASAAPVTRRRFWRPSRIQIGALTLSAGLVILVGYLVYCLATLSFNGGLVVAPSPPAVVLTATDGKELAIRGVFKGEKLPYADIPQDVVHALVATEDRRFFEHAGIDFRGALRALWRDSIVGHAREGGSTLTQQLVRMLYLSPERTLRRKVQEAMLALWIERQRSKQQILADYLNTSYFGAGVYGIDAAAKRYFGKAAKTSNAQRVCDARQPAASADIAEPASQPRGSPQSSGPGCRNMVRTGAITREQADAAHRQPATPAIPPVAPPGDGYFLDSATAGANRLLGASAADLEVATTLDPDIQALAEAVVNEYLAKEGKPKGVSQAALVAIAPDGAILAMVGGRDYAESQFNRVTQAQRQPGSLFKLFVYLTALERGFTPQTTIVDRPIQIGNWSPENFEGRHFGAVSLRAAFAHSINGVAAQLGQTVEIKAVIQTAKALGVEFKLPDVPSLALGTAEVNLLELVGAYATVGFGDSGVVRPFTVKKIQRGDQVVYQNSQVVQPAVVSPQIALRCSNCCVPSSARGPGLRRVFREKKSPAKRERRRTAVTPGSSALRRGSSLASGLAMTTIRQWRASRAEMFRPEYGATSWVSFLGERGKASRLPNPERRWRSNRPTLPAPCWRLQSRR